MDNLKEGIDYEVANARTSMKNAMLTVDNQKQNEDLAEKVYKTKNKKYKQGLRRKQEI